MIATTDWVGLSISAAIGVVGTVLVGWIIYRVQLKRSSAELVFRDYSIEVARAGASADIELRYRGQRVPRVTRTQFVMWNHGGEMIDGADNVPRDPLRFSFRDGAILTAEVKRVSRQGIDFTLDVTAEEVRCSWALLDRGDGVVIDVLHTGPETSPVFQGTVKHLPEGVRNFGQVPFGEAVSGDTFSVATSIALVVLAGAALGVVGLSGYTNGTFREVMRLIAYLTLGGVITSVVEVGPRFLSARRRAIPATLAPTRRT